MAEMKNPQILWIILFFLIVVFVCPSASGKTIYVDDNASGANDGSSWENAYVYLQDALADANDSDKPVEIFVANGSYKPDQEAGITTGNREIILQTHRQWNCFG